MQTRTSCGLDDIAQYEIATRSRFSYGVRSTKHERYLCQQHSPVDERTKVRLSIRSSAATVEVHFDKV